jgi:hypothetical protein
VRIAADQGTLWPNIRSKLAAMSIYATAWMLANEPAGARPAPIEYRGSHVLPEDDSPRRGRLLLCEIPGFIERDGRPARCSDDGTQVWPWLRLSVQSDEQEPDIVVVLDRNQVEEIRDYLTGWLERAE